MQVTFHGVRGSTPCHGDATRRYGGNTSCVSVRAGEAPEAGGTSDQLLLDLGTGLRYFGLSCATGTYRGACLLTHLHWDHLQGLPFFTPLLRHGSELTIYAPRQDDGRDVDEALHAAVGPPLFPVPLAKLPGTVVAHEAHNTDFEVAGFQIVARSVRHLGPTNGYRITRDGRSVAYISDHQQPLGQRDEVPARVRELAAGADLLIHDSQYTADEFAQKQTWGHSTIDYTVWLASQLGVRRVALFHHDPNRTDDHLDELVNHAHRCAESAGIDLFAAVEGQTVEV